MKKEGMLRKSQGFNAAVLVAIIAGLIIIYMLFLPAEDRENMLKETNTEKASTNSDNIVLLKESVGRLDPTENVANEKIPNVYLFESTNSKELASLNPVYVRNGLFDEKTKTASFSIDNIDNVQNVVMSFTAPKRSGILTIKLNDNIIYEYDLNKLNVDPIKINKKMLKTDNILEFSVSSVGMKFWTTNEYSIENIMIVGDETDKSRQESRNVFSLTDTDYQNLESAELKLIPYCGSIGSVGVLNIEVNNHNIYSSVPVCDDLIKQDVPLGILNAGTNKVIFKTTKGSYSIEQIEVNLESKDTISNVYYFEVNDTTYKDVTEDDRDITLTIRFVDKEERKRLDLDVNGHSYRIDQYEKTYTRDIRSWIEEDNNFVKLTPKTTVDIVEMMVEVEK
ncbi:MAG: hypothetical protein ABIC04_05620 [Nanoarchaeota archaeon]